MFAEMLIGRTCRSIGCVEMDRSCGSASAQSTTRTAALKTVDSDVWLGSTAARNAVIKSAIAGRRTPQPSALRIYELHHPSITCCIVSAASPHASSGLRRGREIFVNRGLIGRKQLQKKGWLVSPVASMLHIEGTISAIYLRQNRAYVCG